MSNAGGLGILGAAGMSPDKVRDWIRKTKNLTNKPFGLDLILPSELSTSTDPKNIKKLLPPEHIAFVEKLKEELDLPEVKSEEFWENISLEVAQEVVKICFEEGIAVFASGLGNPGWVVPEAHKRGMLVMGCVGNTKNSRRLKDSGVDIIIAQGYDGGGHTGRIGTMSLIPQVVDAVRPTPVLGAGGIADGRGLAAALTLGAEGIWVGTAFAAAQEANVDSIEEGCVHVNAFWDHVWKQKLLNAVDEDTTVSKIVTGKTARYLKNKLIDYWDKSGISYLPMPLQGLLIMDLLAGIVQGGKSDYVCPFCGQGAGLIKEVKSAGEVVNQIVEEAIEILTERIPKQIILRG